MVIECISMPSKKISLLLGIVLLAMLHAAPAYAETTIRSIQFLGNDDTQDVFLRRTIFLKKGDVFSEEHLTESLQALIDTGLFKNVDYYLTSDIPEEEHAVDSQIDLVIVVREKHYLILLPRFRVRDNHTNVGLQLRWDNLFGMNHQLRALAEDRGSTAGISENRNEF